MNPTARKMQSARSAVFVSFLRNSGSRDQKGIENPEERPEGFHLELAAALREEKREEHSREERCSRDDDPKLKRAF